MLQVISLIPIKEISKTVKEIGTFIWLSQADVELQIYLLLVQKIYVGKFSAEKVEQIMFKYPWYNCVTLLLTVCASLKYIDQCCALSTW